VRKVSLKNRSNASLRRENLVYVNLSKKRPGGEALELAAAISSNDSEVLGFGRLLV
jgi:hypothetical protein